MNVGTAEARPGELTRGWLNATGLPTGGDERLPVVVARGERDGPTLWLTGGVHGDEATGVAVAQDAMREELPELLSGTVVCVPLVNPAGLRRNARTSYYADDDPNRYFPDPEGDSTRPPKTQERIDRRLYETLVDSADALVDLHTAQVGSMPFSIRDRVLYGERRTEEEAESLADELAALVDAFGLPVLTEYPAAEYLDQGLHRSTAGAALNAAGIPSFTPELGGHSVVEEDLRAAGVAGVYGVLRELGMIDELPAGVDEPGTGVPSAPVEFPVRRAVHPRTETAGVVRHRVDAGDVVSAGDVVADIVTPHGERVDTVESEHDGYVIGRYEGLAAYEGDAVASMAVRDDDELVVPRDE
ncbi:MULTISPECIES: succinylglutamate desuccinylase/aspartoacylase family protein [Haloprofundus]|uniref:succinylglutamate desuccinylase/aspartoacylase family protein n=1 Tax=Haloprofundus TaxID=1911573 RepID=UPI000E430DAE|nr:MULTISPECIES: succinylglutamate desuccinylase/aspartoacylase family protein [Haloprofundus]QCJ46329.1 deacylase [Haloprofundus sp. MHR1]